MVYFSRGDLTKKGGVSSAGAGGLGEGGKLDFEVFHADPGGPFGGNLFFEKLPAVTAQIRLMHPFEGGPR